MTTTYRQYNLIDGNREMLCWLDNASLKKGQMVTLKKDPEKRKWTVDTVFETVTDTPQWRTWKVGGLL